MTPGGAACAVNAPEGDQPVAPPAGGTTVDG